MELSELLRVVTQKLEALGLPYFVTGSIAAAYLGDPRFTNHIDIVVDLLLDRVDDLCAAFPEVELHVSEEAARKAVVWRGQFSVIHPESGHRIDLIVPGDSPFNRSRFTRAQRLRVDADLGVLFATPEDVILKRMESFRESRSEKHLRDIAGVLRVSASRIDRGYIAEWAARLGLGEIWEDCERRLDRTS